MCFKGYAAGLLDGEGSIQIQTWKTKRYYCRLAVSIGSSDVEPALFVQERWGGSISETRTQTGKAYYRWQVVANQALCLLQDLLPQLIIKKEQAVLAIEFQEHKRSSPTDKPYDSEMKQCISNLNTRTPRRKEA